MLMSNPDNPQNSTETSIDDVENATLQQFETHFIHAMELRQQGNTQAASKILLAILKEEPRLPEPHLEIAHIYYSMDQLDDAQIHIEQAVQQLENGGQWLDIPENDLLSIAYVLQGEIYRGLADQDEIVLGNPERFQDLINRAKNAFNKAKMIDPANAEVIGHSRDWAWEEQIESSINTALSESLENERQHGDQSHHTSSDPQSRST
jgi:tetratricopeptide (TPR) repeat protein